MENIYCDIKSIKEIKRKEYNLIRSSNSSLIHEEISLNVKSLVPEESRNSKLTFVSVGAVPEPATINLRQYCSGSECSWGYHLI